MEFYKCKRGIEIAITKFSHYADSIPVQNNVRVKQAFLVDTARTQ